MLKPTAYLTVTLAGDDANAQVASAVKRSYSYLAPTTLAKAAPEQAEAGNRLALDVRLPGHPYLVAASDEANRTWSEVMLPWLKLKLGTLFGSVAEFNNPTRKSFVKQVGYSSLTLTLEGLPIRIALDPDSSLRNCEQPIAALRTWLAARGDSVRPREVSIPSDAQRGDEDWFEASLEDGTKEHVAC